jgi:hypothetical protein
MINEKNKYLTMFESIPNPIIMLNREMNVDNINVMDVSSDGRGYRAPLQQPVDCGNGQPGIGYE